MFVPFILEMSTIEPARFLWPFCKALDFSKRTNSAVIAGEIYCNTPITSFQKDGQLAVLDQTLIDLRFMYKIPTDEDQKSERLYSIDNNILEQIIREKGSISDAWCNLLTFADPKLSQHIEDLIERIEADCGKKIEGFIVFQSEISSLATVARKRDIPIIHWELGCLRYPVYFNTVYWDLEDLYGGKTVERRWERFCQEQAREKIPVFSKQEILALMLEREHLHLVEEYYRKPTKKVGVALGYTVHEPISIKTHLNDEELLYRIREEYGMENMLIRRHPGDPYGSQYPIYIAAMDQQQRSTPEFILDCETVVSLMSSTVVEAMLFNRKAITLCPCPAYYAAGHKIEEAGVCAGEDFLSFFAFCYLVPLEYVTDIEYLRWRLTMPAEREIYQRHLEFYFKKKGLPVSLIQMPTGERLDKMLALQQYHPKEIAALEREITGRDQKIREQEQKIEEQGQRIAEQEQKVGEQAQKIVEQEQRIREQEQKIGEQGQQIAEQEQKIGEQGQQIAEQMQKIREQEQAFSAICRSKSFKIGRAATYLPRKVRGGIRRN